MIFKKTLRDILDKVSISQEEIDDILLEKQAKAVYNHLHSGFKSVEVPVYLDVKPAQAALAEYSVNIIKTLLKEMEK